MENIEDSYIPSWLFSSLFGQTPGFYYTCSDCDLFLNHECKGDKTLYYPTECSGCSFGGELLSDLLLREEEERQEEMESQFIEEYLNEAWSILDD